MFLQQPVTVYQHFCVDPQSALQTLEPQGVVNGNGIMTYYTLPHTFSNSPIPNGGDVVGTLATAPVKKYSNFGASNNAHGAGNDTPFESVAPIYERNIYVASLPKDFDDDKLRNLFARFGDIISAKVMPRRDSLQTSVYGFVLFARKESAARARSEMIGHIVGGNKIQVRQARPSACQQIAHETGGYACALGIPVAASMQQCVGVPLPMAPSNTVCFRWL